MNTDHLVYILEAYKCSSVNKAAHNCYISQSHLSAIIKNAEAEIGYSLFSRTPNGITPTPEGRIFLTHAEKMMVEWDSIRKIPDDMRENNRLSIVCGRSMLVLEAFLEYRRLYPNFSNSQDIFLESGLRENLKTVVARTCRLGILMMFEQLIPKHTSLAEQYNLEMTVLHRGVPVMALMSLQHPLAKASQVTLEEIQQHPFAADFHIDPSETLDIIGLSESPDLLYVSDRGTTLDAVRKGGYISISASTPKYDMKQMGCTCRPIVDCPPMAIGLIHPRDIPLRPHEQHFIHYLTSRLQKYYTGK